MFNGRGDFRWLSLMATFLLAFAFLGNSVYALGLSYSTQYVAVNEGETRCVTYKVFNSGSSDIEVEPIASEEFADLTVNTGGSISVSAQTPLSGAILADVCFDVPSGVYSGGCPDSLTQYEGTVDFVQAAGGSGAGGGSGSTATVSAAAPLIVEVACEEGEGFGLDYIYPILAVLIIIVIIILLVVRKKQDSAMPMNKQMPSNMASGMNNMKGK